MHNPKRPKRLTNYISSRLTQDEEELICMRAEAAGITKSEWCRRAILGSLDVSPGTRLVLQEVLALRKIFLALQLDKMQGEPPSEDRLRFLVDQAESTKRAMAETRVVAMRSNSNE